MFGSSKPVILDYGKRRSRWRPPRWLVLLLLGVALGGAGVVLVQERYLPPRLSAADTAQLRQSFAQADSDRQRLGRELSDTTQKLNAALGEQKRLSDELTTSRDTVARLREDVASLVAALPPDPRGGTVEVRAARFAIEGGALAYDVVLSRERAGNKPLSGVMQFVVAGDSGRNPEATVTLKPVAITVGRHETLRGTVALPEGFKPRQTTINVLDRPEGRLLGMRVMLVK
jgi:hypothetical protein